MRKSISLRHHGRLSRLQEAPVNTARFCNTDRFWGCWAAAVTAVILYSPDSPAVILQDYRSWYIDLLLCYTAFVFMRGFVRLQEQRRMGQVGDSVCAYCLHMRPWHTCECVHLRTCVCVPT